MADVVQMDYRYLFEYARRQQLEPLDDYIGDTLDLSHFDDSFLDSGRVGGKLYAVPWTSNSIACFYDQDKLAELGVAMPDHTWTYDDLRAHRRRDQEAGVRENYWGVADKGHWEPALEFFLRQRGKALYTEDGGLGYGEEDVADYFGLWQGMREEGLVPTPEITVRDTDLPNMPLTIGTAAIDFAHSNQLVALQALNPHKLGMNMFPNQPGGQPGQYLKPSMLISVSATSQVKDEAVKFTSFLASDLDAAAILRVERGVPGDAAGARVPDRGGRPAGEDDDRLSGDRRRQRLAPAAAAAQGCRRDREDAAAHVSGAHLRAPERGRRCQRVLTPTRSRSCVAAEPMSTIVTQPAAIAQRAASPAGPACAGLRRAWRRNGAGYLFLLPWLVGFFGLTLGPTLASLYLSFTSFDLLTPPQWIGLENYDLHVHARPALLAGAQGHVHLRPVVGAAQADRGAGAGHAARQGHSRRRDLPGAVLPALAARRVGRGRRALAPAVRARGRRQPAAGGGRLSGRGLAAPPRLRALHAGHPRRLAVRLADGDLPRRASADPDRPLRGRVDGRREQDAASSCRSPCRCWRR